jgi:hypothetical protein
VTRQAAPFLERLRRELNFAAPLPTTAQVLASSRPDRLPSRRIWRDRVALGALSVASCAIAATVNVHQRLHVWAEQHEPYDPFRLLPVAAAVAVVTLAYLIATRRRLRREVAIRREREDALTQALLKIEVLSGLLAMCASCKRIRDGDRWEPVERYLQRHGEVSVSHDVCPQCVRELYPDYVDALAEPPS